MEITDVNQMCSSFCLCRHYLLSFTFVALFLIYVGSFSSLFSSILFSSIVSVISTLLFTTFTKPKPALERNEVICETVSSSFKSIEMEEVSEQLQQDNEGISPEKECQEVEVSVVHDCFVKADNFLSESESVDLSSTSDDSDADWPYQSNMDCIRNCSDDSIDSISDDEDSLIEIALPEGNYISPKHDSKLKSQLPNFPDFFQESLFRQKGLMELLADINEMNEEDNMIEIDISMGSIKCSRIEITA
ncbi:hypothetical protein AQUCO_00500366v1 [Aquilegia coerulea]|uniref:Transmembrane protein n=1 Tax=Aquilegia coerulea TaxID=218851 RepID=A0A2G5ERM6_AQUCA|nr:hypothetical protein AQUCO_00500366v1 [Aquilegia coerulea]PIA58392.1 hypothetical protein AQUCO_00500366v1 [Aquilegia coerulea]